MSSRKFLFLPGSVMPTTSSLLSTSATTCTAVWLTTWPLIRWMEGVSRREQVRAASILISLCSLFKKWSAQWRTNWVRECPGLIKEKIWMHTTKIQIKNSFFHIHSACFSESRISKAHTFQKVSYLQIQSCPEFAGPAWCCPHRWPLGCLWGSVRPAGEPGLWAYQDDAKACASKLRKASWVDRPGCPSSTGGFDGSGRAGLLSVQDWMKRRDYVTSSWSERKQPQNKISTRLNPYSAPETNSQHGFQEFLDVWLDARTHGSGKHADTSKDGGVHLHGLLSPAHIKDMTQKIRGIACLSKNNYL